MPSIVKGAFEFESFGNGLTLRTTEYHCRGAHLTHEELRALGLEVTRPADALPPSRLLGNEDALPPDLDPSGPGFPDRDDGACDGHQFGDFRLVLVREGLDVYVDDYRADESTVPSHPLEQLGLAARAGGAGDVSATAEVDEEESRCLEYCDARAAELAAAHDAAGRRESHDGSSPVLVVRRDSPRIELVGFARFRGRFSAQDSRQRAEAVHHDAEAAGRIHLFCSSGEGRYFHFHLQLAGDAPARVMRPTAWGLTLAELDEAQERRRDFVRRHARLVRLLLPGPACAACGSPHPRRSYHLHAPDEDVMTVEYCLARGEEPGSFAARLVDLSPALLALYLPARQVAKLAGAAGRAGKRR